MHLTPKQSEFVSRVMNSDKPIHAWAGSIRSGKTFGAAVAFTGLMMRERPGDQFLLAGRTIGALQRNVFPYLFGIAKHYGWKCFSKMPTSNPYLSVNGRIAYLFGGSSASSEHSVAGVGVKGGLIDEVTRVPEAFYYQCAARLSESPNARLLLTLNKGNPNHWFCLGPWADTAIVERTESTLDDNQALDARARATLKTMFTGAFKARLIDNKWAALKGLVYDLKTIASPEPDYSQYEMAMDWGPSGVTTGLVFGKRPGGYDVVDEYYHDGRETGRLDAEVHARRVAEMGYRLNRVIVDPSAIPLISALRQKRFHVISANNELRRGVVAVVNAFSRGTLRVFEGCKNLIRESGGYEWDEYEDKPRKGNDHCCDALRYGVFRLLPVYRSHVEAYSGF